MVETGRKVTRLKGRIPSLLIRQVGTGMGRAGAQVNLLESAPDNLDSIGSCGRRAVPFLCK